MWREDSESEWVKSLQERSERKKETQRNGARGRGVGKGVEEERDHGRRQEQGRKMGMREGRERANRVPSRWERGKNGKQREVDTAQERM